MMETIQEMADRIKAERKRKFNANIKAAMNRSAVSWGYKSWKNMLEVEGKDFLITGRYVLPSVREELRVQS